MNIYDIAEKANVSIATVSRVLNNKPNVSEKSRSKVLSVLNDNNFRPSAIAQGLVHNTSNSICIVIEDIRHSHYISIAYHLERSFRDRGFNCIITNSAVEEIRSTSCYLAKQRPRGIVIIGSIFANSLTEHTINADLSDIPVIMINGVLNCPNVTSIFPDDAGGVALAVGLFAEKGYEDILFVKDNTTWSSMKKLEGYMSSMEKNHIPGKIVLETTNTTEGGRKIASELISRYYRSGRKLGVVFSEDITANGCLQGLIEAGISVPGEVSLIGYDNSDICRYSTPQLTSIDSRPDIVGSEAARILESMFTDSSPSLKNIVISPTLVQRGTTE